MLKGKRSGYCYPTTHTAPTTSHSIRCIDSLLETPIEDHRKYPTWRIVAPYLINVRKLSYDETFNVIGDWLNKPIQHLVLIPISIELKYRYLKKQKIVLKIGPVSIVSIVFLILYWR